MIGKIEKRKINFSIFYVVSKSVRKITTISEKC